jgi:sugar lactone lactonase YvrE
MRASRLTLLLVALPAALSAQSIVTIGGGGPVGDGFPAAKAILNQPQGFFIDGQSNVYVADYGQNLVRRIDAKTRIISTIAGGGSSPVSEGVPATQAQVNNPVDVAVDPAGNIYINTVDPVNRVRVIQRIDSKTGIMRRFAGGGAGYGEGGPATAAEIPAKATLAIDAAGDLIVCDGVSAVRKVSAATGVITTIAGGPVAGFAGDDGPATVALLSSPRSVAYDRAGNLYISDIGNRRIRRVDASSREIRTVAGNGNSGACSNEGVLATDWHVTPNAIAVDSDDNLYVSCASTFIMRVDASTRIVSRYAGSASATSFADGIPATEARLYFVSDLSFDHAGNLLLIDSWRNRVRAIAPSGIISTLAGSDSNGDGGPATAANLLQPVKLEHDGNGNLVVVEYLGNRVRQISLNDGRVSTLAGNGLFPDDGDGGPATLAAIGTMGGVTLDATGNIYVTTMNRVRRIDRATGIITTIAGDENGDQQTLGDGGSARSAFLYYPMALAFERHSGDLFIADYCNQRIRRVSSLSRTIWTYAGASPTPTGCIGGFGGDGGPATQALLNLPTAVAVDDAGNLCVADYGNGRVRRIDATTSVITTIAGGGTTPAFDGCVATEASIEPVEVSFDGAGTLYIAGYPHGVWALDKGSTHLRKIAGVGVAGFGGDGGPAKQATMFMPKGVAVDKVGNIYVSDTGNNRVRAIYACTTVASPQLSAPADGASGAVPPTALSWAASPGAFRYDVRLDVVNPPARVVATDLVTTNFTASNLASGTKYYWQVVAKGDPNCTPQSTAASVIRSFTTSPTCQAPGAFAQSAPADAATAVSVTPTLSWSNSSGASRYEIFLGTTNPPPSIGSTNSTNLSASLARGTRYYWTVRARASCDESLTTSTPIRSFTTTGSCAAPGSFVTNSPVNGATGVSASPTLTWSASSGASSYDLYLGTTSPPALYLPDIQGTSAAATNLLPGRTYTWLVVAKVACDPSKTATTPDTSFTTGSDCPAPGATTIVFIPPGRVGVGQTYSIAWRAAAGLAPDGEYLVERSTSASFASEVESQVVSSTAASFVATATGTWYHRVRALADCDPNRQGPPSPSAQVVIIDASPNVVFTVQPPAVFSPAGGKMEDQHASFTIENISNAPLQVLLGKAEIDSVSFFTIVNPEGGDSVFVSLEPRVPKRMELRFSGPPNDSDGAYQGLIIASTANSPIIPYAFVNLKVGSGAGTTPRFRVGGVPAEYAYFPGLDGDDTGRAPITVEIENPGTAPMDLGGEVGPEVWLVPEAGWNASPIPAGATRSVRLKTRRVQAPNNSALPRYTYFTIRTREGASARLLVQDNAKGSVYAGRLALGATERSLIVPNVVSGSPERRVTRLRLSNVSTDKVPATIVFTPQGTDGFDQKVVKSASVVIPPNDVVTLTDPLAQIFGLTPPAAGQCEVIAPDETLGFLGVSAEVVGVNDPSAYRAEVPVLRRGDGAVLGADHVVPGITESAGELTTMRLVETTGLDVAQVRLTLHDSDGNVRGQDSYSVPRYGRVNLGRVVSALSGPAALSAGRIDVEVTSGAGHVMGIATISDTSDRAATTILSRPQGASGSTALRARAERRALSWASATGAVTLAVPFVSSSASGTVSYRTVLGLLASRSASTIFTLILTHADGGTLSSTVTLQPGKAIEYANLLTELFGLAQGAQGALLVQITPPGGDVYSRLVSSAANSLAAPLASLPVVPSGSLGLTSAAAGERRPIFLDGLEQSTDASRGSRWNLYLAEVRGASGSVMVSLYEAGNRSVPIAQKVVLLGALQQARLETVFSALGLDSDERRKDRTNVMVTVTPISGNALVGACAVSVDNKSGNSTAHMLAPAGGVPSSTASLAAAIQEPVRRRPVRR